MYHSEATLTSDGNVLIAGSNPNEKTTNDGDYPTIYQTQLFHPHYTTWGVKRNKITKVRLKLDAVSLKSINDTPAFQRPPH